MPLLRGWEEDWQTNPQRGSPAKLLEGVFRSPEAAVTQSNQAKSASRRE